MKMIQAKTGVATALVAVCLWVYCPVAVQAQEVGLAPAIALFDAGDWEQAIGALNQFLAKGELTKKERSQARKYLGLSYSLKSQEKEAVATFKELTKDDPDFNLDDLALKDGTSLPEAVRYFGQAVLEVRQEEIRAREAQLRQTSRGAALLRSAVLPGWGQRYQGYQGRGYAMLALAGASLVYVALTDQAHRKAMDAYNQALEGADFEKLYKDATRKGDRANLAEGIAGAVWLINMLDAVTQGPAISRSRPAVVELQAPAGRAGMQLVLLKRF